MIFKTFKIANQTIQVKIVDRLPGDEYGKFNDAKNLIEIAKTIKVDDELVELTREQLINTYFHEIIHAFQFYFNTSFDEAQAQVFANFLSEMRSSGEPYEF